MNVRDSGHGQPVIAAGSARRWVSWRHEQLLRAGFDEVSAGRLADGGQVDLHQVLDLVARGCPPPLAARILGPLTDDRPWPPR